MVLLCGCICLFAVKGNIGVGVCGGGGGVGGSAVHQLFVIEECVEYLLYLDEEGICPLPSFRRNWCISSVAALPAERS